MAYRTNLTAGNWSTAANWGTFTSFPAIHATALTLISASDQFSTVFTAPVSGTAKCYGCWVARTTTPTGGTGNWTVTLYENGVATAAVKTIPRADIQNYNITGTTSTIPTTAQPAYEFIRFATPYTMTDTAAGRYKFGFKRDATFTGNLNLCQDSALAIYAIPVDDSSAVAPVAGDIVYVGGWNCATTCEMIIDGARACGNSTSTVIPIQRTSTADFLGGEGGTLSFDITQNSSLTIDGTSVGSPGFTVNAGSTATPYAEAYTAKWIQSQVANGDHGFIFSAGSKLELHGRKLKYYKTKFASGAGTVASPLVVADPVGLTVGDEYGWKVGDKLVLTGTGDGTTNYLEADVATIAHKTDDYTYDLTWVNQCQNSDFEVAGAGGADVFGSWTESAGSGTIAVETTIVYSGTKSAKLTYVTGTSNLTQAFPIQPGETISVSFWTRGDGTRAGQYRIRDTTNSTDIVAATATGITGTTWTEVTYALTAPAGCNSITLYLYAPSTAGSAYFDSVSWKKNSLHTKDTNCWVLNVTRNVSIEGSSVLLQGYGILDGIGNGVTDHKIDWVNFKYMSAATGKYGIQIGNSYSRNKCAFNYNTMENPNYFGMYWLTTKTTETLTGLIAYQNTNSGATTGYGFYIGSAASKTFNDMFIVGQGRAPNMAGPNTIVFNNLVSNCNNIGGSGSFAGMAFSTGTNITLNNPEVNCNRIGGFLLSNTSNTVINNGQIGTYGKNGTFYGDIGVIADATATTLFDTCYFGSDTLITGYTTSLATAYTNFQNLNGVANNHIWYTNRGVARSTGAGLVDTTVRTSGGLAVRIVPENYIEGAFTWISDIPTGNILGQDMSFGVWVYINSANYWAGTYQMPRLTLTYDNGTVLSVDATQTAGVWQRLQVPFTPATGYPTITVNMSGYTDATGTDSYIYFDDSSTLYPAGYIMNLGGFDTWAKGQPATPFLSTLFSAQDVWNVVVSDLGATGTAGKTLVETSVNANLGAVANL